MRLEHPIYLSWDTLLASDTDMLLAALNGIEDVAQYIPSQLNVKAFGPGPWSQGDYSSVQWYLDRARRPNGQIDGDLLIGLMTHEPWQRARPHYDFMMLGYDLNAQQDGRWLNFVFGLAGGRVSIQSAFRFSRAASSRRMALRSYRLLVAHEFGHVLGLVPDSAYRHDRREGIYHGHCTNLCVMQQVMSVPEVERLDHRLRQSRTLLCDACLAYLRA